MQSVTLTRRELRQLIENTEGEIPTTAEWRELMKTAREARDLSQTALADLLGTTQATISWLETGTGKQSKLVPAIAAALGIPLPAAGITDALERRWLAAGRRLRVQSLERFLRQLELLELDE